MKGVPAVSKKGIFQVFFLRFNRLSGLLARPCTEDQGVQKGIPAQPVGAMDADAGTLSGSEEPVRDASVQVRGIFPTE